MAEQVYYSGKIEAGRGGCFVGDQEVPCPQGGGSLFGLPFMGAPAQEAGAWHRDILPENLKWDVRNDSLFISLFFAVIVGFTLLGILKIKIFGKTLVEYISPIWYFIAGSIAVVFSQYIWVVPSGNIMLWGRVTQLLWEVMVGASAYMLITKKNFGYGNLFFLGVLYSFIIHGLKVSIRYFFYGTTLWYVADRFLYGSLLVMAVAFGFGALLLFFRRRGMLKF